MKPVDRHPMWPLAEEASEIFEIAGKSIAEHFHQMPNPLDREVYYPWDILNLAEYIIGSISESKIEGEVHEQAVVDGNLVLGKGSKILPGVYIEGNVWVGENCRIGPNCYVRGNTSIANGCKIGNGVEVKNSVLSEGTSVAHLTYLGDSITDKNVNIGGGTITANLRHDGKNHHSEVCGVRTDTGRRKFGTVLGVDVHTGINTSIYPGRKMGAYVTTLPSEVVKVDKE